MNLLKTLAAISSMTMLSRITGLLRDSLFARAFGASDYTDAFNIAFRLPNLLRRLFGEGAFSQAFVPILAITAIYGLELMVAFIQAYVFAILTCVYLNDALHPGH